MFLLLICAQLLLSGSSLRLQGSFNSSDFVKLVAKFGFEKTENHDHVNTLGYIYGNLTSSSRNVAHRGTLVVVEREHFLNLWGNRTRLKNACSAMFHQLQRDAFDRHCNVNGTQDFLRSFPCPRGQLCEEEDTPSRVLRSSQFTYTVRDLHTPRFWYVTLVSCFRDPKNCTWHNSNEDAFTIDYDIHLVNGHPHESTAFDDEFSFEEQGSLQRTCIFFFLYLILLGMQCHLHFRDDQRHPLTRILFTAILLQFVSHLATLIQSILFASNGQGLPGLKAFGEVAYIFAQSFFIVLILVISRGYAITRSEIAGKRVLVFLWITYLIAHLVLYVWVNTEIDPIKEIDEYETYPGCLVLGFRMALMLFMLRELRSTMHLENNTRKLRFYLHLAAGLLCWFIYLPILAIVASQVSSLWKQNLIHGIMACADFLAYAVVTHVLWPAESHDYLQLQMVFEDFDDYREFRK
ncbi:integral membrane protein GPR180 [Galendromus occidentalis]|uniref:Integral membrane protein GPR180 n=1 Tax=Galendromus occidentalis TaxID=34638 RepID=A0AAJ7PAP8_9ACAR|nr:integral membrane protein GPR180 [Galendromus occidentalis]